LANNNGEGQGGINHECQELRCLWCILQNTGFSFFAVFTPLNPINPTPRPYLRVSWIRTLLYPGSRGRQ